MRVIRSVGQMQAVALQLRRQGRRIGVVPTMGALHEGHASLIRAAASATDAVIVTVFVNPLQFGPHDDLARYPRTLDHDLRVAQHAGADVVFAPSVEEIYPKGFHTTVEPGPLALQWEGKARPGHFRGVATVVTILFELTQPTVAFFGQKDYQQALVIERLIADLQLPIRLHVVPTVRESDGVAMSSRNAYLSASQRREALVLSRALSEIRKRIREGERRAAPLLRTMRRVIREAPHARAEYVGIVDAKTLEPVNRLKGRVAMLLAVRIGRTRLIDNLLVDVP